MTAPAPPKAPDDVCVCGHRRDSHEEAAGHDGCLVCVTAGKRCGGFWALYSWRRYRREGRTRHWHLYLRRDEGRPWCRKKVPSWDQSREGLRPPLEGEACMECVAGALTGAGHS